MSERKLGQLSLADGLVTRRQGLNEKLGQIGQSIDWQAVEKVLVPLMRCGQGAPGYPVLVMLKALLLAQWHSLSDEELEAALSDRLSFRAFCGLALADEVPDHSTLWRFREALGQAGLAQAVFEEITRQLDRRGVIVRKGTLVDASLIAAQARPPAVKAQETPAVPGTRPTSKLVKSEIDPDAGWTKRGGRRIFGYKAHIGIDQGSGVIRRQVLTSAEVNDTLVGDELICGDEQAVYADKAYDKHARRARLKAMGIKYRIQQRPNKHHKLTARQTLRNQLIGRTRGRVETVWAYMKRVWHYNRVRYFNKRRNQVQFALLCVAYNLKRIISLPV
jgi:IS5 family transposase